MRTAPVWLALFAIIWITGSISASPTPVEVRYLSDTWRAEVLSGPAAGDTTLEVPGLFQHQGLPP